MTLAREEFSDLAVAQMDSIFRKARSLSRDFARAEDLVQDTYLRAIRFRETFQMRDFGIKPWLVRILRGVHCDHLSREARHARPLEQATEHVAPLSTSPLNESDPHGLETMDERLVKAINSLSSTFREVLLLWAIEDLTYQEISTALNVPIGTVMSRLHRARKLVRERIGDLTANGEGWQ
jgi:RNA polymerase sigma-70 factor (ECF subfamily)